MCDWLTVTGGALQVVGVLLLIRGIIVTGRAFDSEFGLGQTVGGTRLGRWWRRTMPQWLGGQRGVHHQVTGSGTASVSVSARGRGTARPRWEDFEPLDAVRELDRILSAAVEAVHQRIDRVEDESSRRVAEETRLRADADSQLRRDLLDLALGGLAREWLAAGLIIIGIIAVTAGSLAC